MEIQGKVKSLKAVVNVTDAFKKRELVIETNDQYPQTILIEFQQDKVDLCNGLKKDQEVKVHINIRGREWTNQQGEIKYFNTIVGWKIDKDVTTQQAPQPITKPTAPEPDDLPF